MRNDIVGVLNAFVLNTSIRFSRISLNDGLRKRIFSGFLSLHVLKLSVLFFLIYNCKCFFPFSCMTTARVQPKGSFSLGIYHEKIVSGKTPWSLPIVFGRYSISDNKELGFACSAIDLESDYLPVFLFQYKQQAENETRWSPSVSIALTAGAVMVLPWLGARVTFSKKIFFLEPYAGFEFGFLPYGTGWLGIKGPSNERFAIYCELNAWDPYVFEESFPEGLLGQGISLAVGLEYGF